MLIPVGISIPIVLPFFYILAATAFMSCYAAYPIIDRYMIAPYKSAESEEKYIYFKENNDAEDMTSSEEK